MGKTIKVLKPFTEQRTGRSYQPGELVTDPAWHAPGDRRAEAYAARELVRIEERAEGAPFTGGAEFIVGSGGPQPFVPTDSGVILPKGEE